MVYKRGEGDPVGAFGSFAASSFALEVTAVRDLSDRRGEFVHSRGSPGSSGATTEPERFVAIGVSRAQRDAAGDWDSSEGEIRWAIANPRGTNSRGYHEHVVGDPDWVTFYRGGNPLYPQVTPLDIVARRIVLRNSREAVVLGLRIW